MADDAMDIPSWSDFQAARQRYFDRLNADTTLTHHDAVLPESNLVKLSPPERSMGATYGRMGVRPAEVTWGFERLA
jgi:hypothetical protein